jgi:hypothetical protein
MGRRLRALRTRATLPYLKTCTLRPINLPLFMVLLLHNGAHLSLSNLRKVLLPRRWRLDGIALWHRFAILAFRHNS